MWPADKPKTMQPYSWGQKSFPSERLIQRKNDKAERVLLHIYHFHECSFQSSCRIGECSPGADQVRRSGRTMQEALFMGIWSGWKEEVADLAEFEAASMANDLQA
jgi:hypothetical protein